MKLQSFRAGRVATVNASAAVGGDEIGLPLTAPLSKRTAELLAPSFTTCLGGLLGGPETERHLRRVVIAEGRACETKAAPVEGAHLSVDNHLRRELSSTCETNERFRRPQDTLSWITQGLVRSALEAMLATAEVAPPPIQTNLDREIRTAGRTCGHGADRT